MAIEDHPKFPEWVVALDRLKSAWDEYAHSKMFGSADDLASLEAQVRQRLKRFHEVSDAIDV